ncbi:fumarylacetoacetate hydrolase [Rhodococcus sp. WS3]|uniref:fumarylacetoacetate hydrolase family protein n=1 Tax=unclassified Rhodococcus (in: high G+C Gram-positive bacteria) TaxID=192944 RepID=UPI0005D379DC|nr:MULTISPECIES: fumarylacetoacetate hydrolase family protein [unclassified Rhodococcus (in: high G+C Gram-positive bacteria)]KJF19322.1 Fumarylacetoacetate (FAA) hydrolase family protein [Rhodococcus sp. AD45]ROZ42726.1 fumarylacetoacetate hydrolase [Rhodococcus sp. WS3]RZL21786.1 MAG: fumarylacetoacetate hydrolase [Rhodococcus sp. (in: high G+C Gram-positive bacteria)]
MSFRHVLPDDMERARLIGRVWDVETGGPRVVTVSGGDVFDLTEIAATVSELLESSTVLADIDDASTRPRWNVAELVDASLKRDGTRSHLLAPVDLQVIKACGVTFVESMIERVIEERASGDPDRAAEVRALIGQAIGGSIAALRPGSPEAAVTKDILLAESLWSQYLEVGIGPDPEVFTKAPVLSSVGFGSKIGIPSFSSWNNPEPELVLIVNSVGSVVGATLGNDVNLRDVEGRSALLLGKAKDNNASSALGPFIRLVDEYFTLDSVRTTEIRLRVVGDDGFTLDGTNNVGKISRSFEELVAATMGEHHQYPDGIALYTGTLFAPTIDRDTPGQGFTHKPGDIVTISSSRLGSLINEVGPTETLPDWTFGLRQLFGYLHTHAVAAPRTEQSILFPGNQIR